MKRVLVGMSGGVDSSVAVVLLQKLGYEVVGITFQFIDDFDATDAIEVAKKLSIEHHIEDYRKEFKKEIIDSFMNDYLKGLTPNPCVQCNRICKFHFLLENMEKYHCDYIATGHYANLKENKLYRSIDKNKDQSYFLYNLPKEKLSKILFPLEEKTKEEIREIAEENHLVNAHKKDSFDVCFITDTFKEYMKRAVGEQPGPVINVETKHVIGEHKGLTYYTIGQRRGLDIGGTEERMFVVGKDMEKNILYVCIGEENDYLVSDSCILKDVNLLTDEPFTTCTAKFRYRMEDLPVEVEFLENNQAIVKYPEGVKRVTPGQACVFYKEDQCLGGGTIQDVCKNGKKVWYL